MLGAYAVYCLYASAAALSDRAGAHTSLGEGSGLFPAAGILAASLGVIGMFCVPVAARHFGYPGSAAALIAICVPMAGAALASRMWATARLSGARDIGELVTRHYGRGVAAITAILINGAVLVLVGLAIYLIASVVEMVTYASIPIAAASWLAALLVTLTAAPAGLRAVGRMAPLHTALVLIGALAAIGGVISRLGGIDATVDALARVGEFQAWGTTDGRGGGDYNAALAFAGAQQTVMVFSAHLMVGSAVLALVWLPWAAALSDPRPLGRIHTWGTAVLAGLMMLAHSYVWGVATAADGSFLDTFVHLLKATPWVATVAAIGAIAAAHALATALVSGAVVATRPLWSSRRARTDTWRLFAIGQLQATALIATAALFVTNVDPQEVGEWAGTVVSFAALALIPVVCVCWFPRATAVAIFAGIFVGILLSPLLSMPAAIALVVVVSLARRRDRRLPYRLEIRGKLADIIGRPADERGRVAVAWVAVLVWSFFAIGPGAVVGNGMFGDPDVQSTWLFPLPSIAIWQLLAWISGVAVVWLLVRTPGLGPATREQVERLRASGQTDRPAADR